jgi:hypothetical protein
VIMLGLKALHVQVPATAVPKFRVYVRIHGYTIVNNV